MYIESKPIAVVTGANGFVGSHLVDLLIERGNNVRCVVRKTSNLRWLEGKDVEIYDCGLFDKEGLSVAFKDVNFIYHVAGVVKSKTKEGYFKGNVETTKNLLEVALKNKETIKRFLVVSSQTVTGPSYDGKPVNEESECNPLTTYGKSKLEEEKLALSYKEKLPITVCRAPAVFGERDTEIFIYFQNFARGITTTIGFDKKLLSLIHVADLVEGFYKAALSEKAVGEIYFISSEKFYNWDEINKITAEVLGKKAIRIRVPHFIVYAIAAIAQFFSVFSSKAATLNLEKAKDLTQHAWICDTSKAMRDFGYRQNVSIEEGIKRTCEWYKKMKWI
ncbi:3 beta-hydroxysteroid dehydrogenase/Delta 5--_4-isomerase [bacterium BMS3Abin03]|nr:3 beta-hydroxysteroid dehydrogenase/Delta 5-->4-isomerase [bacterium BMS3Abin03]